MTSVGEEGRSPCNGVTTGAWPERSFCISEVVDLGMKIQEWLNVGRLGGLLLEGSLFVICAGRLSFMEPFFREVHVDMLQDCTSPSIDKSQNQGYHLQ